MSMPISASTPRIATKPSGLPLGSKAATTPINPSGATAPRGTGAGSFAIAPSTPVAMTKSISGTTAAIGPWLLPLSSTVPAVWI
ncbi:Uncharacterised protein [Brucella neotomae]|nr:Uncharacterised protein [Brucella neotomae]